MVVGIVIIVTVIILMQSKRIDYTYESVTDLTQVRECITEITGSPELDVEKLSQDQELFADVYRFCLKTVDNIEAAIKQLAQ